MEIPDEEKRGRVKTSSRWPGDAVFDAAGRYRYVLTRDLAHDGFYVDGVPCADQRRLLFVLLNPSVATATHNDPTIAKCCRFGSMWRYRHLAICNIFALRATDPAWLYKDDDPVGFANDHYLIQEARRADLVVCAWGAHGEFNDRGRHVFRLLTAENVEPHALSWTKSGQPGHPLYLKGDSEPRLWASWNRP